jgi:hypothetical protein
MPIRADSLVPAIIAGSLAAAMVLGVSWPASAAEECLERPTRHVDQGGHWYYYFDRVQRRKCWYLEMSPTAANPAPSPDPAYFPDPNSGQSWFTRFSTGLEQALSLGTQPTNVPDGFGEPAKAASPKPARADSRPVVRRERSRLPPLPETSGAASPQSRVQTLPPTAAEKDARRASAPTTADREALFEEFLRWRELDVSVPARR